MRIFIVAHTIRGGGAETYLRGLIPQLLEKMSNAEFRILIPASRGIYYSHINNRLTLDEIDDSILDGIKSRLIFDNRKLIKVVSDFHPDIIFSASEVVSPKLKRLKKPIVLVYHSTLQFYMKPDFTNSWLKLCYTRIMRDRSAKVASIIVAVSHYERAEIGMRYHNSRFNKSAVIYHGVDHDRFYPLNIEESVQSEFNFSYIVCISDYHEHKKMDEMIDIFHRMVDGGIKEHLVIVGRPKNKNIEEINTKIKSFRLDDKIHMIEYIDNNELRKLYINASLYWTHSNAESFGLTPLEAMACKVPVFAPWREAMPEVYGNAACFYNTFIDSKDEIARKGIDLLKSSNELDSYATAGYAHSLKFSWEKAAYEYKKLFERML